MASLTCRRVARISLKHKATGENVDFFNTWHDIQGFLATSIAGEGVTEISGWRPSPRTS